MGNGGLPVQNDLFIHKEGPNAGFGYRSAGDLLHCLGVKGKLLAVAGIGRGQLLHLEEHRERKTAIYKRYKAALAGLPVTMNPH